MKKILFFSVFLCLSVSLIAQNLKALDTKNGFRDFKFGDDISTFKDLVEIEIGKDGLTKFYSITDDKLAIGTSELEKISYGFYKDKLFAITIATKGYSNSRGVLKALQELYGNGTQENRFMEKYTWWGSKVWAFYEENSITKNAQIMFLSKPIVDQRTQDEKENAKKASDDL
jgi:hypothetical protein